LNLRLLVGGWLSGDDLPLQRRFALGSAGSLPGYDFRQILPGTDVLTCAGRAVAGHRAESAGRARSMRAIRARPGRIPR
jgi:outer membrane translocation and assembly module TamA